MTLKPRWKAATFAVATLALASLASRPAAAAGDPWEPGSTWLYTRIGYAKSSAEGAGNGGAGYGFGFRHLLTPGTASDWKFLGVKPLAFTQLGLFKNWAVGGFFEYNVLGRYGEASEIEVPAAVELTRCLMWHSAARPYIGFGLGPHYRKLDQTGDDMSRVAWSAFLNTGFDALIVPGQLIGVDIRAAIVDNENKPINPVFGSGGTRTHIMDTPSGPVTVVEDVQAVHWSVKLSYSFTY